MIHSDKDIAARKVLSTQFTTAYSDYSKSLRTRAHFKIDNAATCDDLVQLTFMKTWVYLVKGGKIDLMKSFLYHVLNGLIIDEYRKRKPLSLDLLSESGFEPHMQDHKRIYDVHDGRNAMGMIKYLPKKYRTVIRMRYVDELTLSEMSTITGQSKNTLAVQIHRGLVKLKEISDITQSANI